jgi:3-phytase
MRQLFFLSLALLASCNEVPKGAADWNDAPIEPAIVTEPTQHDTDDPAIWVHPEDPAQSLILGTDKDEDGALYVYNLDGIIQTEKVVRGLKRPNNVDVVYGLQTSFGRFDLALVSERFTGKVRIYTLPNMQPLDGGGITVYDGETGPEFRDLMGITAYREPETGNVYVIPGRKNGPTDGTYLWQYLLTGDSATQTIQANLVRKFGNYSGKKEIEAMAVDHQLGYLYYSDETVGIRKYHADPAKGDAELALFGQGDFYRDNEGISIYTAANGKGYVLVSDQQRNRFNVYPREGSVDNPHQHPLLGSLHLSTLQSDGSEVTHLPLNNTFKNGLFVAMSEGKTFHFYKWEDLALDNLVIDTTVPLDR